MTVREIAAAAAVLLQADDVYAALTETVDTGVADATAPDTEQGASDTTETTEIAGGGDTIDTDADVRMLVKCVNMATAELCADGFPLCVTDAHAATDGFIPISAFTRVPSAVREVVKDGARVPFSVDSRGVRVSGGGTYKVTYAAVPNDAGLDETAETGALCDRNIAAYLTARNYCLITGRTDEASVWDQRYNAEAEKRRLTRRAALKGRKWLSI